MATFIDLLATAIPFGCAGWVLQDARKIGIKKGQMKGFGNMGPWGWFWACALLWIVCFPVYLAKRAEFLRINGKEAHGQQKAVLAGGLGVLGVWVLLTGFLVFGSPKVGIDELRTEVQANIAQTFAKDPQYSNVRVEDFQLVHKSGNQYEGLLKVSQSGESAELAVNVTYDGERFMWQVEH